MRYCNDTTWQLDLKQFPIRRCASTVVLVQDHRGLMRRHAWCKACHILHAVVSTLGGITRPIPKSNVLFCTFFNNDSFVFVLVVIAYHHVSVIVAQDLGISNPACSVDEHNQ